MGYYRLFFTGGKIVVHYGSNSLAEFDQYTFQKTTIATSIVVNRIVWDIIRYKDVEVLYVSDPLLPDLSTYINKLISKTTTINLDTITSNLSTHIISESNLYFPYMSEIIGSRDYIVIAKLINNTMISLTSRRLSGQKYSVTITIPFKITSKSRIILTKDSKYVYIKVTNNKHQSEPIILWRFDCINNKLQTIEKESLPIPESDIDDKLICKSLSKTNLRVSESFIAGDNCISDFGAVDVNYSDANYEERATKSFIALGGFGNCDVYLDRNTNSIVNIQDIVTMKPGYTFIMGLGIGRDDCRVYLAYDTANNIKLMHCASWISSSTVIFKLYIFYLLMCVFSCINQQSFISFTIFGGGISVFYLNFRKFIPCFCCM